MDISISALIDQLRRPQYTGANRCIPCTAANIVLTAILVIGVVLLLLFWIGPVAALILGTSTFALSVATIYVRGYLVPGTPRITKQYFSDWLLKQFDKQSTSESIDADDVTGVEATLKHAGVVTECEHDDLCLTEDFRTAWRERILTLRQSDDESDILATVLAVEPDQLSFEEHDDKYVARSAGSLAGQWESSGAFLADMAAARELRSRLDNWTTIDIRERSLLIDGLRLFLDRCPTCDSPVTITEDSVESCCRSMDVLVVTCDNCGARLFEAKKPAKTANRSISTWIPTSRTDDTS